MKRRCFAIGGMLALGVVGTQGVTACASDGGGGTQEEHGVIALPLGAYASSGTRYRLRNATFVIEDPYAYGEGGGSNVPETIVVSSEDDPDADSINLSVEQGYYRIRLQPGWHVEKQAEGGAFSEVEAQLLSGNYQWVYVSPRSTSWARFSFGIGGRAVWFNGNLNIDISVYEDPDDYYGGGEGGSGGNGS
jgi:hypothetical protein